MPLNQLFVFSTKCSSSYADIYIFSGKDHDVVVLVKSWHLVIQMYVYLCSSSRHISTFSPSLLSLFINHGLSMCWHTSTLLLQKSVFLLSHSATKAFVLKVTIAIYKPMDARVIYYRAHDLSTALGLMDHGILQNSTDWVLYNIKFYLRRSKSLALLGGYLTKYSLMMDVTGQESILSWVLFPQTVSNSAGNYLGEYSLPVKVFDSLSALVKCSWSHLLNTIVSWLFAFGWNAKYFLMVISGERIYQFKLISIHFF